MKERIQKKSSRHAKLHATKCPSAQTKLTRAGRQAADGPAGVSGIRFRLVGESWSDHAGSP